MATAVNLDLGPMARWLDFANRYQARFVGLIFAALIAGQGLGFLVLGTGWAGTGLSQSLLVLASLIAIACAGIAFRRAQGIPALFWFLFAAVLVVLLVPTAIQAHDTIFHQTSLTGSTSSLLFCLYGAPILMMLFLPEAHRQSQLKSEIFLDLFQIAIVVSLVYSTFFFLPVQQMLPGKAMLRNIRLSDAQGIALLFAAVVRLQFARTPGTRDRLLRLTFFLLVCAVATMAGDGLYQIHHSTSIAWFDLGWAIPQATAGIIAITWIPSRKPQSAPESIGFLSFLGTNLALVAIFSCTAWLTDRWKQAHGEVLMDVAITASLLAFTFRLALTQFHQQREIAQRKAVQAQLAASHNKVESLIEDARRQTSEITQISEIGSLLQVCGTRAEVFRLIPERLRRLFTGASGSIALLSESRSHVASVAKWGMCATDQLFSPDECWALRRGNTHVHPGGPSTPRCSHLLGEGPSVCIPLIANGETIGTLSIQNDDPLGLFSVPEHPDVDDDAFARRRQLAAAIAEHIAIAVANLSLRASLRQQAVRDPLTGLYNRGCMQEFFERALHAARRRRRPVAVLMLDLDYFKRYNDSFGHSAGDKVLATVGKTLLRCVRAEDVVCRYGGEEFAIIFTECSLDQAAVRAEEIRKRFKELRLEHEHQAPTGITVSIGVAAFDETTDQADLLLQFADDALDQAKRAGRDRVVAARPVPLPEPSLAIADLATAAEPS